MPSSLTSMVRRHVAALRMLLVFTAITGVGYPLLVAGIAQAVFPGQANGSLVRRNGTVVGSSLLGQEFALPLEQGRTAAGPDPRWFQPRPSAAGTAGYDPRASGASDLGPNDPRLVDAIDRRRAATAAFDGVPPASVPADALTASASGLDPDISAAYAYEQVNRVAEARGLPPAVVRGLVADRIEGRTLGFLGEPRVNVVELNQSLARLAR